MKKKSSILEKLLALCAVVGVIVAFLANVGKIKDSFFPNQKNDQTSGVYVTSNNQTGGVTANNLTVNASYNVSKSPLVLDDKNKIILLNAVAGAKNVSFLAASGDIDAYNFAKEVKGVLTQSGYATGEIT